MESRTAREPLILTSCEKLNIERVNKTGAPARDEHVETVTQTGHVEREAKVETDLSVGESLVTKSKLPKITLSRFSGDITRFRPFWDRFESAVDKNTALSPVDKFNYSQCLLVRQPDVTIGPALPFVHVRYSLFST